MKKKKNNKKMKKKTKQYCKTSQYDQQHADNILIKFFEFLSFFIRNFHIVFLSVC